ncbi:ATP-binding cassette domain-containing protein [Mycoplasmatota bacterium]|nr:ATP-binding cassette domain-containing protein [Mycoplasmatota bacterium]
MSKKIIEIKDLETSFFTHLGEVKAVRGVSYDLEEGQVLGIVGESGSGKSVTSLSIMRLIDKPGKIKSGKIIFNGKVISSQEEVLNKQLKQIKQKYKEELKNLKMSFKVDKNKEKYINDKQIVIEKYSNLVEEIKEKIRLDVSEKDMTNYRGEEIAMIFQDPMTSLNPVFTIQNQMIEVIRKHVRITKERALEEAKLINNPIIRKRQIKMIESGKLRKLNKREAYERAIEYLNLVGIPEPETRINQYPHQFSGGMRQRALIALALSCEPKLLIADEPTTALDVTIQAQILELLKKLQKETGTSIIFITHDLGVIAELCTNVVVMYGGMLMERGTVDEIFYSPQHPYTRGLHQSIPKDIVGQRERLRPIEGSPPDLLNPPKGCPFSSRCPHAMKVCLEKSAPLYKVSDTQASSCWLLDKDAPQVEDFKKARGTVE